MSQDRLSILIQAILSKTTESEFEAELKKIEQKLKPLKVEATLDDKQLEKFTQKFETVAGQSQKLTQETREFKDSLSRSIKVIDDIDKETQSVYKSTQLITNNYKLQAKEIEKIKALEDKQANIEYVRSMKAKMLEIERRNNAEKQKEIELEKQAQKEYVNSMTAQIRAIEKRNAEEKKLARILETNAQKLELFKQKMIGDDIYKGEIDIASEKYGKKIDTDALKDIKEQVVSLSASTPDLENKIKSLGIQFSSLKQQASQSGTVMGRMFENMFKFMRFYLVGGILVRVVNELKNGISTIVELDTSLTELNKVTDLTSKQLARVTNEAYKLGKVVGRTGKEVIDGISEFAKAGYTVEESFNLAQSALVMTNVAEGINSVEEATSSLIAALKGYQLEATSAMSVVDMLNEVSNTTATNFDDLSDGLRRTSGTLAQTGTSIEELIGLLVGGFEPLRNIEMVSSGLTMISQRLRGIGEDGEAIEGLIPKLQKDFMEIAKISIIDPETGGLRSTYDILSDMAKVFPTLTGQQRQYLSELAAGNRQVKVLNAILDNWQSVDEAINSAKNSTGSAMKENEKYLNSINGKVAQFNSTVQQMWQNTISSDTIKFFVDLGTVLINVVDKIGLLNTALIATVTYFTFFKTSSFIVPLINTITAGIVKLTAGLNLSTSAAIKLNTALGMLGSVAIVGGIILLVTNLDKLTVSMTKYNEQMQESASKTNENISKLDTQIKRYKELAEKVKLSREEKQELVSIEHDLKLKYRDATKELDLQNGSLEKNIELIQDLQKEEAKRFQIFNQKAYEAAQKILSPDKSSPYTVMTGAGVYFYDSIEAAIEDWENAVNEAKDRSNAVYNERLMVLQQIYDEYDAAVEITSKWNYYQDILNGTLEDGTNIIQQNIQSVQEFAESQEKLNNSLDDAQSSFKELAGYYQQLADGKKLTSDNMLDLIQNYPEMLKYMDSEGNLLISQKELIKNLFELKKQDLILTIENEKIKTDATLQSLETQRKAYLGFYEHIGKKTLGLSETEAMAMFGFDQETYDKALQASKRYAFQLAELRNLTFETYDKKNKSLSPIPYEDLTKELIKSYNAEVERDKIAEKLLNKQIKQAERAKDYNKAIEIQNKLLDNQQKTIADLQKANQKIHEEANRLRSTSKYDTTSWFDINGEMTLAYKELLNSFAGKTDEFSKKEKESIEDLFNKLSLLKKGWYENADAIDTFNESIHQSRQQTKEFLDLQIKDEIDSLKYVYDRGTISAQQYYDSLIALKQKYSAQLEQIDLKIKDSLDDEIKNTYNSFYENELKILKNSNEDGIISKRQYYDQLVALAEKYGSFLREYDADSFRSLTKEIQFVFDDLKKDAEDYTKSYISYINSQLEVEIKAIEKAKDAYKEAQQEKINAIQKQIDALEKQNSLEKEAEERAKRLKDINKARGELAEIEADKSVRILTNEGWKFIADPKKLKSAREQLDKLNEDYQKWELEQTKKHEKEKLQEIINALKEEMSEKEKLYNKDIENLRSALTENNKLVDDSTKEQIKSWDALIEKLQELGISYETELAKAIEAINNYNNAVLTMENKANIPDPKPSGIPSSSTINKSKEIQIVNELLQEAYKQQKTATGAQLKNIKEIIKELEEKLRKLRSAKVYDVGGILPTNSMAINTSGKPERILPPQLTVTFDKFVNKLPNLMKVLDSLKIPNFNFPYVGNKSNNGNGQVVNYYVNIDKVETPDAMSFINDLPRLALQYK